MYIDAFHDKDKDLIKVVERINGKRIYKDFPCEFVLYYPDQKGKYTSIFGDKLSKIRTNSSKRFFIEKKRLSHLKLFESDTNIVFKCLADNYLNADLPKLNIAFFDIEVGFNKEKGHSQPSDPFNPITAIGTHLTWLNKTVCFVVKPDGMSDEEADTICNKFDNVYRFETEEELLLAFMELIEEADVLSGWNSSNYDIPYVINRVIKLLGKHYTKKFCLWNLFPTKKKYKEYGKEQETYILYGRVHLDYLQVYRNFTYHEMHSYSLDSISEHELKEKKVAYEGTLDQLYNEDFETFIEYNIQDTNLLKKLENKLKFIQLANLLAHSNTVQLSTALGSVAQVDQAIINQAHSQNLIVPNKRPYDKDTIAAGGYVATPRKGMFKSIGSIDLSSLYPSVFRACNLSPETLVAQVRHTLTDDMLSKFKKTVEAWEGKFACLEYDLIMNKDKETKLYVDYERGGTEEYTGAELHNLIFNKNSNLILTANGTLFSSEKEGIIPTLLSKWYDGRKDLQANLWECKEQLKGETDKEKIKELKEKITYWDQRQYSAKILLNSLYGALLSASRFHDIRMGQSCTLTGRCITRHMISEINENFTGKYDYEGDSIIYGDTDSGYFSAYDVFKEDIENGNIDWDKTSVVELYDAVSENVNRTFPDYMLRGHNCPKRLGKIIEAKREIVGESGIFISKKRYGILVYDKEGERVDNDNSRGDIKTMGSETKRSDTPVYMQDFLKKILRMALEQEPEEDVIAEITEFRKEFRKLRPWEKGTPKRVNNLTDYTNKWKRTGRCDVGHVMAAINYNRLREMNDDKDSMIISDGMKTIVVKLKKNLFNINSIAIPIDENRIPDWFKELPFDEEAMEETIFDKKIQNVLGVLNWNLDESKNINKINQFFDF